MTATADAQEVQKVVDGVSLTIDGREVTVPKGTLIIRAAEEVGIEIPRFCDHPLLKPAGACRQCLVDVASPGPDGSLRAFPKPQASCTMTVTEGMVVNTQHTSAEADRAQKGVMELLLINHPLDCPVCDKGGECPLQNQALAHGRSESRFVDVKRVFDKPLPLSSEILLDRERCVLCQRCTRFSKEIAGDAFIDLQNRGAMQQIGTFNEDVLKFDGYGPVGVAAEDESGNAFSSYYSGNTVQICPVGALTSAAYRFRARPFDLVSSQGISEHDSSGAAIRTDHRRGSILRRLADPDPVVNEEWITDKDRFAFTWQNQADRIRRPLVRKEDGELHEVSWPEALSFAAEGLKQVLSAKKKNGVGVLPGGRVTLQDAYAYSKFARVVLGTNDIDARTRPSSEEEQSFLGAHVAGLELGVTFSELEKAPAVLLVAFEPEEEGGVVFLRMRKALGKQKVIAVAPYASRGLEKLAATVVPTAPGAEGVALGQLDEATLEALKAEGAVIIVGERLANAPGGFTAALALADQTGAKLAWIPRRAGERAAVESGTLPALLPGGRAVSSEAGRAEIAALWGVAELPAAAGRDANAILAATGKDIGALVIGGVTPSDVTANVAKALKAASFVVNLEVRRSEVAEYADVVFPVAPPSEKSGTFVNWEGRARSFTTAIASDALSDYRVLDMLAQALGTDINVGSISAIGAQMVQLTKADAAVKLAAPQVAAAARTEADVTLASWHLLIDQGALQDGEPYLAGTARQPVARLSAATAEAHGIGSTIVVTGVGRSKIELPAVITDMVDGVVWVPTKSPGSWIAPLGVEHGDAVTIKKGVA